MATTITRGLIGKEDLSVQNSSTTTFARTTSSGGSQNLTKLARSTLCTREFDVMQFGAVGDGSTDDTTAIQAAITAATTATGGMIVFPAGYTFRVQPPTVNLPVFAITASGNLTFWMYGATIKVTTTTALQPTSTLNEKKYAYVFKATNVDNLTFLGGTFDGNRDEATGGYGDPRHGFFAGVKCSNVIVKDMHIKNVNSFCGAIYGTAYDITDNSKERIQNWKIVNNLIEQTMQGIQIAEVQSNITIENNDFVNMDIGDYVNTGGVDYGPSFTPTYYTATAATDQRSLRSVKITGYVSTTAAADGQITDINVSNNRVNGASDGIEVWNGSTRNPESARRVTIVGNTVWAIGGIHVNVFSEVAINNNTINRMQSTDIAAYAGRAYNSAGAYKVAGVGTGAITAIPFGPGIEAGPGYDFTVMNNAIDGGWADSATATINNGSPVGIICGAYKAETFRPTAHVVGNAITRCIFGIRAGETENALIAENVVTKCRTGIGTAISATLRVDTSSGNGVGFTRKNNVARGNLVVMDDTAATTGGTGGYGGFFEGDWVIEGNTFVGPVGTMLSGVYLLTVRGYASVVGAAADISSVVVRNNVFKNFQYAAFSNSGGTTKTAAMLRIHMSNNTFDSEQGSPGATCSAFRLFRPQSNYAPIVTASRNHASRMLQPVTFTRPMLAANTVGTWATGTGYVVGDSVSETASGVLYTCLIAHTSGTFATDLAANDWVAVTETYDFGEWTNDGTFTAIWVNDGGTGFITGGTPIVGFGPRRKAVCLRTNSGAATVDLASFIPANSSVTGLRGQVQTTFTYGGGGSTWALGCPFWMQGTALASTSAITNGDTTAWGTALVKTAGTDVTPANWLAPANAFVTNTTAATIRLTANTGTFTDGYVNLICDYIPLKGDVLI